MTRRKTKIIGWWAKVFILALFVVFLIRTFLVESYTVSSSQMETALCRGDRVLVKKTAYGMRMPMTLLTVPFTFDHFLGFRSYSRLIELAYCRLFTNEVTRNDVVLFNNPSETQKPLDKRSLLLSRCVAVSGDTITVNGGELYINNLQTISSPDLQQSYHFASDTKDTVFAVAKRLSITPRNVSMDSTLVYATLSRYEAFLMNRNLGDKEFLKPNLIDTLSYQLVIPAKGMKIELSPLTVSLYKQIIEDETQGEKINIYSLKWYTFRYNYYWFLSDNPDKSVDSRTFGFISEKNLIGKASLVWYSSDSEGNFRWNRILSKIK